jgi:hypothetical protein
MPGDTPGDSQGQAPNGNGRTKVLSPRSGAGSMALRGMHCFPVWGIVEPEDGPRRCACPKGAACGPNSGKHPIAAGWQEQATDNQQAVKQFFLNDHRINYGIFCGASNIVVLDADERPEHSGIETIRRLEGLLGFALPLTWCIRTGSGSLHFIFKLPPGFDWRTEKLIGNLKALGLGPGVDVKWGGGYIVGPGSNHLSGKQYLPLGGEDGVIPWDHATDAPYPVLIPPELLDLLRRPERTDTQGDGKFGNVRETVLYLLCERALLIRAHLRGGMVAITCPWSRDAGYQGGHDAGSESSTVITGAVPGKRLGGFICLHGKCDGRTSPEFRALFDKRTRDPRWPNGPSWLTDADTELDGLGVEPRSHVSRETPPRDQEPDPPPDPPGDGDTALDALTAAHVRFIPKGKGKSKVMCLVSSAANLATFLTAHPGFRGAIARNTMTMQTVVRYDLPAFNNATLPWPPAGEVFTDPLHYATLASYFEQVWQCNPVLSLAPQAALHKAVQSIAERNEFSPLFDMIAALPPWDGTRRIERWIEDVLGVTDVEANRMGELWMLQAVARVLNPGCQADLVLILEGRQGIGKNKLVRAMNAPFPVVQLGSLEKTDEAVRRCNTGWIIELGELAVLRKSEIEKIKDFITCSDDLLRKFYTEQMHQYRRRFVLIGTTNHADYLTDHTGNRRFLPIACPQGIDVERFTRMRSQLYAEAKHRITAGEQWWPTAVEERTFEGHASQRVPEDLWEPIIERYLTAHPEVTQILSADLHDLLCARSDDGRWGGLDIPVERWTPAVRIRIGNVLSKLGWRYSNNVARNQSRAAYSRGGRGWMRPEREPGEDDLL